MTTKYVNSLSWPHTNSSQTEFFSPITTGDNDRWKKTNDKILHHDNCIWIQNKFITFKIRKKYIFVIEIIKNRKHPFSMLVLIAYLKGKRDKNIYHRVRSLGPVPFFSIFQGSLMMLWKRKKINHWCTCTARTNKYS